MPAAIERSVVHASFAIERSYKASPARVFNAWASIDAKSVWFHGPNERAREPLRLDFRMGGQEVASGTAEDGTTHRYEATYLDIVPNQRFILAYAMHVDDHRISASLMTVELFAAGAGTRLRLTEQDAFLDGWDGPADREEGTRWLLDQLEQALGG